MLFKLNKLFICYLLSIKTVLSISLFHQQNSIVLNKLLLNAISNNSNNKTVVNLAKKHSKRNDLKEVPAVLKKFQSIDFLNSEYQFCGETLFYAVEYFCVYVKGTSVYTPENDLDATNVINETKQINDDDDAKSKRDTGKKNFFILLISIINLLIIRFT